MSHAAANDLPGQCPRCRSATIAELSRSPVAGVWTVFNCATCLYAWRSTEPEENTNPDSYPLAFRLDPADLAKLPVAPSVPPRRPPAAAG